MSENKYNIYVSPSASERIKQQLVARNTPDAFLRLGIKGGGCSGYSYSIQFEDNPPRENKDLLFQSEGINIIVDIKSIIYLNGSTLDWEKSLTSYGFKFINPNVKTKCGCGNSFTT